MDRVGVFYTFSQQKGRGQAGNEWFCGRGDNIAMTLVFQPRELEAMYLFCLDMALSMGMRIKPLRVSQKQWSALPICSKTEKAAGNGCLLSFVCFSKMRPQLYWGE